MKICYVVVVSPKNKAKSFYTSLIVKPIKALDKPGNTALVLRQKRISMIQHASILER
jgi:hypothetical protein